MFPTLIRNTEYSLPPVFPAKLRKIRLSERKMNVFIFPSVRILEFSQKTSEMQNKACFLFAFPSVVTSAFPLHPTPKGLNIHNPGSATPSITPNPGGVKYS